MIRGHLGALREHNRHDDDCEQDVHHGTHDEHLEPLPFRLRQELVWRAAARIVHALAGHLHVAAEGNRADGVFGVAALGGDQLRAEAERKGKHADADAPGRDKMSELVYKNEHPEHEQKRQDCRHAFNSSAWAVCRAHSWDH